MEREIVVEAVAAELQEVLDVLRRDVIPELRHDVAEGRGDHDALVVRHGIDPLVLGESRYVRTVFARDSVQLVLKDASTS
jgi:hypothetical protein